MEKLINVLGEIGNNIPNMTFEMALVISIFIIISFVIVIKKGNFGTVVIYIIILTVFSAIFKYRV